MMIFTNTGTPPCAFFLKNVTAVMLFLSTAAPLDAQDTAAAKKTAGKEDPIITWVAEYPSPAGRNRKRSKTGFVDVVFGRQDASEMSKPVALLAESPDTMWVLDQGNGVIYRVRKTVGGDRPLQEQGIQKFCFPRRHLCIARQPHPLHRIAPEQDISFYTGQEVIVRAE